MAREVRLGVTAQDDPTRPIPVELFTRTLNALRAATCHAGEMLVGADERDRGRFGGQVAEQCQLLITELRASSALAIVSLPEQEQPRLLGPDEHGEELEELGERALGLVLDISEALVSEGVDDQGIIRLLPQWATERQKARFFNDMAEMSPTEAENARVSVSSAVQGAPSYDLTPDERRLAQSLANPTRDRGIETQERTIIGQLVELRVKTEIHFCVEHGDEEFVCPYDEEFFDVLRENLGNTVSLRGLFRVRPRENEDDQALDLLELIDVRPIDMSPLVLQTIEWGERQVSFTQPIRVPVSIEYDTVLLACEDLRIFAHGDSVQEAAADFAEQVLWVWDTYGRRSDQELSPDAQAFKLRVRRILTEGEPASGHQEAQ